MLYDESTIPMELKKNIWKESERQKLISVVYKST